MLRLIFDGDKHEGISITPNSSMAISPGQVWPEVLSPKVAVIEN